MLSQIKFFYRHFKLYLTSTAEHFSKNFKALIVDGEGKEKEHHVKWEEFFTGHVVGEYEIAYVCCWRQCQTAVSGIGLCLTEVLKVWNINPRSSSWESASQRQIWLVLMGNILIV